MDLGKRCREGNIVDRGCLCIYGNLKYVKIFSQLILYVKMYLKYIYIVSSLIGRWSHVVIFVNDILSIYFYDCI